MNSRGGAYMIQRKRVWKAVLTSWGYTLLAFFEVAVATLVIGIISYRFVGPRGIIGIATTVGVTMMMSFLLSEVLITLIFRAKRATPGEYGNFIEVVRDICKRKRMWCTPRLYILALEVPNAMAFGWGIFGMSAIGITPKLYEILEKDELRGVIAHEIAHIRCRDTGIMTMIGVLIFGVERLRRVLLSGKTALGKGPFTYLFGLLLWTVEKFIFGFLRFAVSQERELAADALGASYVGTPEPLMSALRKLEKTTSVRAKKERTLLDDIMISHPAMNERFDALSRLMKPKLLEGGTQWNT